MRVDKFLKVSRIIKRRTVANQVCSQGRVTINGRVAKPGTEVKPDNWISSLDGQKLRGFGHIPPCHQGRRQPDVPYSLRPLYI